MSGAVFLDRDGTLIEEVGYLDRKERVELYPYATDAIRALNRAGIPVVMVDLEQILEFPRIPELRDPDYQRSCIHLIGGALRDAGATP